MIKFYQALLFINIISINLYGQDISKEFGKINSYETGLKIYEKDKNAEAVVFYDIGKSHFQRADNLFDILFERKTKIKILSEAGIKWSNIVIPYYQEGDIYEEVFDIKINIYNHENGFLNKQTVDEYQIYEEKIDNYWKQKKIAIPNVKKGSIIEYTYRINSQYKFNLRDWEFQWEIPVIYSEYTVNTIPFYDYSWLLQGANDFDYHTSNESKTFRQYGPVQYKDWIDVFVMDDVPALYEEDFITSMNDYILKVDFQLVRINHTNGHKQEVMTNWESMISELLRHKEFGKYINKSKKIGLKMISLDTITYNTPEKKYNYLMNYVKSNYKWNNTNSKFAYKTPSKFIEDNYGNSAEINLFAIGLLNAFGIESYPLLISTRDHGRIKYDYPYAHFFNYVLIITKMDENYVLSDATELFRPNNLIPPRCINDKGIIIKKNNVEWIQLNCKFPSEIIISNELEIKNHDSIVARVNKKMTEYEALLFRKNLDKNLEILKKECVENNIEILDSSIVVQNVEDVVKPLIIDYEANKKIKNINGQIYISPFLNEVISDNPFKLEKRQYPIDMNYPKKRIYKSKISIPKDFKVDFIPADLKIENHNFALKYNTQLINDVLVIYFEYYFKKDIYSSKDYSSLKFYFKKIIKKGNEAIVLKKES
jgi:Domain of Unknown Function with PDB structure (DUF3857)